MDSETARTDQDPDRPGESHLDIPGPVGVIFPDTAPSRRAAAAPEDIGGTYYQAYDLKTLFYDCFLPAGGGRAELLGPPMMNLKQVVRDIAVGDEPVEAVPITRHKIDRLQIDTRNLAAPCGPLRIDLGSYGVLETPVHPRETAFDGRRVLLTLFRYEPGAWVADWARYHVQAHGVDAVLVYANYVNPAVLEDLRQRLQNIPGLEAFAILNWNFPYGPVADDAFAPGIPSDSARRWKSCFCQTGVFEHARLRFLSGARGVLNMDVDELAVTESGRSIFELLEEAPSPVLILREKRVGGTLENLSTPVSKRRHSQFNRLLPESTTPEAKWVLDPLRLEDSAQWMTHTIRSAQMSEAGPEGWYAHFAPLNMGWREKDRARLSVSQNTPPNRPLSRALERAGWARGG